MILELVLGRLLVDSWKSIVAFLCYPRAIQRERKQVK